MPIYVYKHCNFDQTSQCEEIFEKLQSMSEKPLTNCLVCGSTVERIIQTTGITIGKKHLLSDKNLKKNGFTKLVNEGNGKFRKI